jgi:hypothetical protein
MPPGEGACMQTHGELRLLKVDLIAALAPESAAVPRLPSSILTTAMLWLEAGAKTGIPAWEEFDFRSLGEAAAYANVIRCHNDMIFTFVHAGSRLTALLGEEIIGRTISSAAAVLGEIDWYRRCSPVVKSAQVRIVTGRTNPPYTTGFDFIAADFPFMGKQGDVSHILGVTVPPVN